MSKQPDPVKGNPALEATYRRLYQLSVYDLVLVGANHAEQERGGVAKVKQAASIP